MEAAAPLDVDDIIRRLLAAGAEDTSTSSSAPPPPLPLTHTEIRHLCTAARELLLSQPTLLTVPAPVKIFGDIHGQYEDLLRLFHATGGVPSSDNSRYLFLGDYVDRGKRSVETICLLLAYKLRYPDTFFLLRGNHEFQAVNVVYGFSDECRSRRLVPSLWKAFNAVFACLPLAALVVDGCTTKRRILCVHGGLSPELHSLDQIRDIERPLPVVLEPGLVCDLLWSDPADDDAQEGWGKSRRSESFTFGADVVEEFCERHGLHMVCRAHEMKMGGYDDQFANGKLVTVFSAPNYCGRCGNDGAVMAVSEDLACSFHVIEPTPTETAPPSVVMY